MSQSSNDTFPTAMHIAAVETLHNKLYGPLNHLIEIFEEKVKVHASCQNRTYPFAGCCPLTFGQEISAWKVMLEKSRDMLHDSEKYLLGLAIGGTAVGTGLNSPKDFGEKYLLLLRKKRDCPLFPKK